MNGQSGKVISGIVPKEPDAIKMLSDVVADVIVPAGKAAGEAADGVASVARKGMKDIANQGAKFLPVRDSNEHKD